MRTSLVRKRNKRILFIVRQRRKRRDRWEKDDEEGLGYITAGILFWLGAEAAAINVLLNPYSIFELLGDTT